MQVPGGEVAYRLDAEDRIVWVNDRWDEFAAANGAVELTDGAVLGRPVWEFIAGDEVRHLHRALLQRVRGKGRLLDLPFRCDAPALRRFLLMDVWPLPARGVEYRCRELRTERREPVSLFAGDEAREGDLLRMCSWCRRVEIEGAWFEVEDAVTLLGLFERAHPPPITHTICPRDQHLVGL